MENLSENLERYIDCISFLYDLSDDVKADKVKNLLENLINEAKDIITKEISHLENTAKNLELEKEKFLEKLSVCLDIIADDIDKQKYDNHEKKLLNCLEDKNLKEFLPDFEDQAKIICNDPDIQIDKIYTDEDNFLENYTFYLKTEKFDTEFEKFQELIIDLIKNKNKGIDINEEILSICATQHLKYYEMDTLAILNRYARQIPGLDSYPQDEKEKIIEAIKENYVDYFMSETNFLQMRINHSIIDYNTIISKYIDEIHRELDYKLLKIAFFILDNEKLTLMPSYLALSLSYKKLLFELIRKDGKDMILNKKYHAKYVFEVSKRILKDYSYDEKILKQCIENFLKDLRKETEENPTNDPDKFYSLIFYRSLTDFRYILKNEFKFKKNTTRNQI
ncbi:MULTISPECIES: hypothetical protein [Campylobacter]|uniref:hypothetical protein n=1 Tax=Campylobacter TaxID=194 RepID=UPI0023F1DE60|nr:MULTISPECIES: hypothetical protein [Campylobacter]MCI6641547.1 hypothetical protein [Campylobacter sp.]MDD7422081.1 hypothetical protein [Campylobacter hominis]MDY3117266.1 hypothetical protein [Campylobacter hominis]